MYYRPDRPLVVKCSLDSWNKKITFSSARNCSYDVLRRKVEQCYSLSSAPFAIAYKDDDGEISTIISDSDLTEAIQYFQAGDDPPLSSAASILSGRSFGNRKVTIRVQITVDYDGPSLSDTSSLVSLDEYRGRNTSQQSFSFGSPSVTDDDSITVSSKDNSATSAVHLQPNPSSPPDTDSSRFTMVSHLLRREGKAPIKADANPFSDKHEISTHPRYPDNSSAVLKRLKFQEELSDDFSSINSDSLIRNSRGAAWLKDQNERTIRSMLGALPEPSVSDSFSLAAPTEGGLEGDLALERDPRGRYYYTYTSAASSASQTHESALDDNFSHPSRHSSCNIRPRPTSRHLNWLAAQQIPVQKPTLSVPHPDDTPFVIDKELLQFLPLTQPPSGILTDCSNCGNLLDSFRYVCSTCGEKHPTGNSSTTNGKSLKGDSPTYTYPPQPAFHHYPLSSSPATSLGSSETLVSRYNVYHPAPSSPSLVLPRVPSDKGFELCSSCLELAGVHHAIETGLASGSSPVAMFSNEAGGDAASQWRRAPPKKGHLRHAFLEKVWSHNGWEDVEQDETEISKCSTCQAVTSHKRYKCASCPKINLCRACYSQVHELHPSHAFLNVPDKHARSHSDPASILSPDPNDEQPLKHPGVKCAHCLLDIVGARFHCAICDSVDICSNCESAGLPGNLDSIDGGHNSSHILIKIPIPLETQELENASRRAIHRWTGGDAASVGLCAPRSKPSSVVSSYARTVVGSGTQRSQEPVNDHHLNCSDCGRSIIGIRYQCANCPSSRAYNLCEDCEQRSYIIHDPMHIFFKLPRPVLRPIESPEPMIPRLYQNPAGPKQPLQNLDDPTAYLTELTHSSSICDRCMTIITGAWFRCAYCALDLCDACENVDTHDDTHVFLVFKSEVNMQVLKEFLHLDMQDQGSPPIIPYPVYR